MAWNNITGGSKGIRVVFADKTFIDFKKQHATVLITGDKYSGELQIGDWTGVGNKWIAVASFQKDSYSYVIQIP
jgi:hypothetical protein